MKKLSFFLPVLTFLVNSMLFAGSVEPGKAAIAAGRLLKELGMPEGNRLGSILFTCQKEESGAIFYIFSLQPAGYAVLSADDCLPPMPAYSFEDPFGTLDPASNPLLQMLITDCSLKHTNLSLLSRQVKAHWKAEWDRLCRPDYSLPEKILQQWPPAGTTSTGGWLETNWTQDAPYNNFCPMDPVTGSRSIAGCPAVAMAQIVNYSGTINNTQFTDQDDYYHNYAGRQYWIDNDYASNGFPSFPQLNTYLDSFAVHMGMATPLTNDDKAAITFACGVAANQVYTSSGSGTFGVSQAYQAYQRFGYSTAELLMPADTDWPTRVSANIKNAVPAHLAVVTPAWDAGHNLVMDGYNTSDYFHLNFGWGGAYNGWYLIPAGIPYNLTVLEGVIVNLMGSPVNLPDGPGNSSGRSCSVFPNPSGGSVYITYSHEQTSSLEVSICSAEGRQIAVVFRGMSAAGQHIFRWDPKNPAGEKLPAGLYFCRIKDGQSLITEKILSLF